MERVVQVRVNAAGPQVGPDADGQPRIHIRRPSLAIRVAVLTFLVIVGLPLLILFGLAAVVAAAVFGGLALLTAARRRFEAALPGDDGRENVRVKR
jgi:hypothetical protein